MNGIGHQPYNAPRPSDARRAYLRETFLTSYKDNQSLMLANFCPIERYYVTADKVFEAFLKSYESYNLDDAYVIVRISLKLIKK